MIQTFHARLTDKKQLTHDIYFFKLNLIEGEEINFQPGQYLIVHVPQEGGEIQRRLLSIITPAHHKNHFGLLIKYIPQGVVSEYLKNMRLGEEALFQGPAGVFIMHESPREKIFIATGTGIAPIKSMIYSEFNKHDEQEKFQLIWGLRTLEDVYYFEDFKNITQENPNFEFKICLSRQPDLPRISEDDKKFFYLGRIDKYINEEILNSKFLILNSDFYICGGRDVVESLKNLLLENKIPREQLFFEKF